MENAFGVDVAKNWIDMACPGGHESGTRRGTRKVREVLYIAALSATRQVPSLIALRERMLAAGKAPQKILIAAARQLLVILNAMIRSGQPNRL